MAIRISVQSKDNTKQYTTDLHNAVQDAITDLGNDLQGVAKQAAPEKDGNLVGNITVKFSNSGGAYQADLESTAMRKSYNYAVKIHDGKYKLGEKSKSKPQAQSKLGNINKNVGRQYLIGSGEKASKGYREYLMKQVDAVNKKYST